MKKKMNLLLLLVSAVIVVLITFKLYYPMIQGKLQTDLNAVYLAYTDPVYHYDNTASFTPSTTSEPGIVVKLGNGSRSSYGGPEFSVTYQIHSKFDRLTGKLVLTENQNIEDRIINVKITADKSTVLYQEEWDITSKPTLDLDIPLDKVRVINLNLHANKINDGEVIPIGLLGLAASKDNAEPSIDEKILHKDTASHSFDIRSLLQLPKKVNHPSDADYFKLYDFKHSMKIISFLHNPEVYATDFHGEISFFLLDGLKKDPLNINPEAIKIDGATYEISKKFNGEFIVTNITPNANNIRIYIPKGTRISRDGYQLEKDFVIKNVTIVSSTGEGVRKAIRPYIPTIIIIGGFLLFGIILSIITGRKRRASLQIDACVLNITISLILCFVVFGVPSLLSNSFLRGGYDNDLGLMLLMGMFVIPCGAIIVYRLLMTWKYNLKASGIFLGTIAFAFEIILTVSGVYLIGMLLGGALVGSIAGVKAIMKDI